MLKYLKCLLYIELAMSHLAVAALATNDTWDCGDGYTIALNKLCDGIVDCNNGRDETAKACISNICKDDQYRCAYGGCLKADAKCDNEIHCIDRSDETEFLCDTKENVWIKVQGSCNTNEEYQCHSGECIDEVALCDGTPDCSDESDESISSCAHMICPNYSFRCAYGACISILQVCNNIWDCVDGSDELCSMSWEIFKPVQDRNVSKASITPTHTCTIPHENTHLTVINKRSKEIVNYFDKLLRNDVVEFRCSPGFELIGVDRLVCNDNNWYRQWPNCTRSIKIPNCRLSETTCDNGDCISKNLLCDGTKNCRDGSDETPLKCLNRTCTPSEFQCRYGACIHTRQICDNERHCADGSDETRLLCTKNDENLFDILQNGCKSTDDEDLARCPTGECIPQYLFCDGTPNCAEGSDETVQMCAHLNCTNSSFTCAYGACVPSTVHCDGRMDCADGSDEIAELCGAIEIARAKHEEEHNFNDNYESNIDKIEAKEEDRKFESRKRKIENATDNHDSGILYRHCTIPVDRIGLRAATQNEPLKFGSRVKIGSIVKFYCEDSWQLVDGESELLCMPLGKWSTPVPKCEKRCPPLSHGISTRIECTYESRRVDCESAYHLHGTNALVRCAPGYKSSVNYNKLRCGIDGQWDAPKIICEPKCLELSRESLYGSQFEVLVNIFRLTENTKDRWNKNFKLAFNGTIISPKLVLTCKYGCCQSGHYKRFVARSYNGIRCQSEGSNAGQHFRDTDLPNNMAANDPTIYSIVPARLKINNFYESDRYLDRHNISQIILAENPSRDGLETPAIVVLVDYFVFRQGVIMPICLKFSRICLKKPSRQIYTIDHRDNKGVAYLLDDCFVIIGQNNLILMDKYQQWLEMQIMRYKYLL